MFRDHLTDFYARVCNAIVMEKRIEMYMWYKKTSKKKKKHKTLPWNTLTSRVAFVF